jgi:nucleotide-binding universal stress UspA family protein
VNCKSLMVHLELGRSNANLLRIAADLAERFDAAVIGVAACQPIQMVYGDGFVSGEMIEQERAEVALEMKKAEAEFRSALSARAAKLTWRSTEVFAPLADYLAREARCADLVVTGVATGDLFDASRAVNTGALVMQVGRPVLIVPAAVTELKLGRVLVGWKDTRETRRAVADALPLLAQATHVAVAEIAIEDEMAEARARVADVAGWLLRHGINAEPVVARATQDDATRLSGLAQEQDADLIVAGAYGHSRLREWALGGVTRDLLLRTDRCSLVSH